MRAKLETFRTVADFTYDWEIWLGPNGGVRYASPSCLRVTGRPRQEALSDPLFFHRIIHPGDLPDWLAAMRASSPKSPKFGSDVPPLDFRILRADGQTVWIAQETTRVFGPGGRFRGLRLSLRDVTDRVRVQEDLREAREKLEERVRERTRELERSRERYRALSGYLQERIEEERTRISREIHDELGQNLTALNMGLARLARPGGPGGPPDVAQRVSGLRELTAATLEAVRRISRELRPPMLDELGFREAVSWRARSFEESTGIAVDLRMGPDLPELGREAATALFRVFQEALTNVARHAGASRVRVFLTAGPIAFTMAVADDGVGIGPGALESPDSLGLAGMRERMRLVGGELEVRALARGGTRLKAVLPLAGSLAGKNRGARP
jgi:PAS domain S-box-containing protein